MIRIYKLTITLLFLVVSYHGLAKVDLIPFDFKGMRTGDMLTEEFRYKNCPAKDIGKTAVECFEEVKFGDEKLFVVYYFVDSKLIGITLTYDYSQFNDVVAAFTNKFGVAPIQSEGDTFWLTDSGTFSVAPERADLISDESIIYMQNKQKERQAKMSDDL